MNWYMTAQQQTFPFYNPVVDQPIENRNAEERKLREDRAEAIAGLTIEEFIEDHVSNEAELYQYFRELGLHLDKIDDFPNARPIYVFEGRDDKIYVIDEFMISSDIVEAHQWVDRINEMNLHEYVEQPDPNEEFWNSIGNGSKMYHGTHDDRIDEIMKPGGILEARDETRGMSNRGMGAAVFMSADPSTASYYYDKVIEVDIGAMKADGFMPQTGGEEPLEEGQMRQALAWKLGLRDYYWEVSSSDGLAEDTVVIYDDIPNKYLTVLD